MSALNPGKKNGSFVSTMMSSESQGLNFDSWQKKARPEQVKIWIVGQQAFFYIWLCVLIRARVTLTSVYHFCDVTNGIRAEIIQLPNPLPSLWIPNLRTSPANTRYYCVIARLLDSAGAALTHSGLVVMASSSPPPKDTTHHKILLDLLPRHQPFWLTSCLYRVFKHLRQYYILQV